MANAQERRRGFATSNVRNRNRNRLIRQISLPRGYTVESDESEILSPNFFKALHPSNPSAAKQAEKEYIAERWRRYPGKVYDRRERPILIDSLKEHHRKIEITRRDEFNAKWKLFLERQEEEKKRSQNLAKAKKIETETLRLCQQCNNFAYIAVDGDGICSECMRSYLRNQTYVNTRGRSRIPPPQTAAQRRQRYQQSPRNPVYTSAIPLPRAPSHRRRKYQPFEDRVYPPTRHLQPSVPLVITERQPYTYDMANFPQDLESFPLGLPEQEVNYHDQDWRYTAGTMEDRDQIAGYFLSKSDMPVYNEADFN